MEIRPARPTDADVLARLVAAYRVSLAELRGEHAEEDLTATRNELNEYVKKAFPVFVAEGDDSKLAGYIVCRVDGSVVWAESLFVLSEHRRTGVGTALYERAEEVAEELGGETVYNWVHPDNDAVIEFLAGRGYDVLNLIELRRPRSDEEDRRRIAVGRHEFRY